MTATERVAKFKQRQKDLGRKPFNTWLSPEAIKALKQRAKGKTAGEVIEALLVANVQPGTIQKAKGDPWTPEVAEQVSAVLSNA
jgi:hypothetical protein